MNIRDIARLADVTPGTVSKVLNNYPDISEATKQHVLRIIEENQYDPKVKSRASKSAPENNRVGLVVEGVYNGVYSIMTQMLSIRIHNAGYTIISFHDNFYVQDKVEKFAELRAKAERDKLCALIYIGGNFEKVPQADFDALPCPTIFVNAVLPFHVQNTCHSSVQVSHFETGYAQMKYLIDQGHKDICTVFSSSVDNSVYALRVNGYRAALSQARLEHNYDHFLESDYLIEKAYHALLSHLMQHPGITAVCCEADVTVPGILRAIHDAGKVPGKDIAVISFDGLDATGYAIPSVTTFAQPVTDMVNFIDNLLFKLISKTGKHQNVTFTPPFMKRETC